MTKVVLKMNGSKDLFIFDRCTPCTVPLLRDIILIFSCYVLFIFTLRVFAGCPCIKIFPPKIVLFPLL